MTTSFGSWMAMSRSMTSRTRATNAFSESRPYGKAGVVGRVDEPRVGAGFQHLGEDGQSAEAGIEHQIWSERETP